MLEPEIVSMIVPEFVSPQQRRQQHTLGRQQQLTTTGSRQQADSTSCSE
jgi:hypothetical protein